jgi:hypothetical protein
MKVGKGVPVDLVVHFDRSRLGCDCASDCHGFGPKLRLGLQEEVVGSAEYVYVDAELLGGSVGGPTDIGTGAEVELAAIGHACREGLAREQPAAVPGGQASGVIEQRAGIDDGENLGMGEADCVQVVAR